MDWWFMGKYDNVIGKIVRELGFCKCYNECHLLDMTEIELIDYVCTMWIIYIHNI